MNHTNKKTNQAILLIAWLVILFFSIPCLAGRWVEKAYSQEQGIHYNYFLPGESPPPPSSPPPSSPPPSSPPPSSPPPSSPPPSSPPPELYCEDLSKDIPDEQIIPGETTIVLTCSHSGNIWDHYNYRLNLDSGPWLMPNEWQNVPNSVDYAVPEGRGITYTFQCQACDAQDQCTVWGEPNAYPG